MKGNFRRKVQDYFILTLGIALFAIAWEGFMLPNNMSSGGLMGLLSVVQFATGGSIDASLMYPILNLLLLVLAFIVMGVSFGTRTIYCIVVASIFLNLVASVPALHAVEGHFFHVNERFLIPIIAGIVEGAGLGMVFSRGGSSGGSDIIALIINKYWPISPGRMFFIMDFCIISLILLLPDKHFSDVVYALLMMVSFSTTIDYVLIGNKSTVQLMVFSEEYKEIADYIINVLDRGVTVVKGTGWYTKSEKNVLMIYMRRNQIGEVTRIIKDIDPKAFVSVSRTSSVYGEGFEEIKTGIKIKKEKQ